MSHPMRDADSYEPEDCARQYGEERAYLEDADVLTHPIILGMRVVHGLCLRCGSSDGVERLCRQPHDPTFACLACADDYHAFWDEEDEGARRSRL